MTMEVPSTTTVLLACTDLMTASRLDAAQVDVRTCRDEQALLGALREQPGAIVVVDLQGFPHLPQRLREEGFSGPIAAFAPHVREDLLEQARSHADEVLPRGAVVKRFPDLVERLVPLG